MKQTIRTRVYDPSPSIADFVPVDIELSIDLEAMAKALAMKAYKSKSKRSKLMAGIVVAKIISPVAK